MGPAMARIAPRITWFLLALSLGLASLVAFDGPIDAGLVRIDALTGFLAVAVSFVSAVVHGFAGRYMDGDARIDGFFKRLLGLTLVVLALLAADHVVLFVPLWLAMGWLLADLIGHARDWPQARAAAALARRSFLFGGAALALGVIILGAAAGTGSISGIVEAAPTLSHGAMLISCVLLLIAGAVQCGLFPFHRWLLSSMTAPTPVSAFMHAGIVNAGGILLARFAPVFEATPIALDAVFLVGLTSAGFGAVIALTQSDVKRALASSTVAQMGFMMVQIGLGFPAAAMAHLVLHGCYKAYLFLGAGSAVLPARRPGRGTGEMPAARALMLAASIALIAAIIFSAITGKGAGFAGTGLVLLVFVAAAAFQAVLSLKSTEALPPLSAPLGITLVAAFYGFVVLAAEACLAGVPGMAVALPVTWLHLVALAVPIGAWLAVLAGLHRRMPALYIRVLAWGQADQSTITDRRRFYRA